MSDIKDEGLNQALAPNPNEQPPLELPTIVLEDLVPFPGPVIPVFLDKVERRQVVLAAKNNNGFLLLINKKPAPKKTDPETPEVIPEKMVNDMAEALTRVMLNYGEDITDTLGEKKTEPAAEITLELKDLNEIGVVARVLKVVRTPDDRISCLLQLVKRAKLEEIMQSSPHFMTRVNYPTEALLDDADFQATYRQTRSGLGKFFELHQHLSDDFKNAAFAIDTPSLFIDFIGQHLSRTFVERLSFLQELDINKRMLKALEITLRELDLLAIGNKISQDIRQKFEKNQREFLLREQLKSIRTELGEEKDSTSLAVEELQKKLDSANLPEAALHRSKEELKRLKLLPQEANEHHVIRTYLEWLANLPWAKFSEDAKDLVKAREVLDADHYGLKEIKDRIIEFLAVHQLNPNKAGSILCFVGPPGVGKTSLGQSIAKALNRQFYRFSVGGMRDEAEIKGHRRTYIGAMPGRILQALKLTQTANPVIMLDELDKMGHDWRGDPASALLEVLDPAQNKNFNDHYLDLSFDLSRVMFIATANSESDIPFALRDRLEIIDVSSYIPEEKIEIALQHLWPRQLQENGLDAKQLQIKPNTLKRIIREYTHEAGVRELHRLLGKICRKHAVQVVQGERKTVVVNDGKLSLYLGPPKIHDDRLTKRPQPGVAVGLAWTSVGGDVLFIELASMPGKGSIKVTGHLGEVMSESAQLAVSYVKIKAQELGIDFNIFKQRDFHLHFPAGAVRKDGPSAGITITTALVSLLTNRSIEAKLAMTGEMTLRGEVLPVGGIREKVVAAKRAGVVTIVLPKRNQADVEEIPNEIKEGVTFEFVSNYNDVLKVAFKTPAKNVIPIRKKLSA